MHVQTMQTLIGLQGGRKCEAARFILKNWIPLSYNTVIKHYIPFMEKRGALKTYKVDKTWRQGVENATFLKAYS